MDQGSGATVVVVAAQQIGRQSASISSLDRRALHDALVVAAGLVQIPPARLRPLDRTDGLILVVDRNIPPETLAGPLVTGWDSALGDTDSRLRYGIGMDHGLVTAIGGDWSGDVVTIAEQLVKAEVLQEALAASRRARLALITSDAFYRAVVEPGPRGLDPSTFARVTLRDHHPQSGHAWIHAVGYPWPRGLPAAPEQQPAAAASTADRPARAAGGQSGGFSFSGNVVVQGDMFDGDKIVRYDRNRGLGGRA